MRTDETAGQAGYSNNEKEGKKRSYLYAKRSVSQTAESDQKLKQQLCALGGFGGTDHGQLPHHNRAVCSVMSVLRCDKCHLNLGSGHSTDIPLSSPARGANLLSDSGRNVKGDPGMRDETGKQRFLPGLDILGQELPEQGLAQVFAGVGDLQARGKMGSATNKRNTHRLREISIQLLGAS